MGDQALRVGDLYWTQREPNEWVLVQMCDVDEAAASATAALVDEATGGPVVGSEPFTLSTIACAVRPANPLFTTSADMTALRYLHEASLVKNLHDRWIADERQPYTSMSNVLIAVNPLRYLTSVDKSMYVRQSLDMSPPHPFHVAENAYRQLRSVRQNQSIVISGESGSGKTETSKIILDFLTDRSGLGSMSSGADNAHEHALGDRLMKTIPILESFGNAKTHRNHNSSRFGKYMRLQFSPDVIDLSSTALRLTGASIDTYLLETSRVVLPPSGERNFHVLYELLRSGDAKLLNDLKLIPNPYATGAHYDDIDGWIDKYQYLNQSGCTSSPLLDDRGNFGKLVQALKYVNIDATDLFRVVSGLLHLGNVQFGEEETCEGTTAAVHPDDMAGGAVAVAAEMLGLEPTSLVNAILTKKFSRQTQGRPGMLQREASVHFKKKDTRQASYSRDTIAKVIYEQVFGSLMRQCADALEFNFEKKDELPYIGVLDIFGFEDFEPQNRNSLEQLMINYANETLQSLFNQCILKAEQELYTSEHIWAPQQTSVVFPFASRNMGSRDTSRRSGVDGPSHAPISYVDNNECLSLIAAKHEGIFAILDTVAKVAGPTDQRLIDNFHKYFGNHPCFVQPHPKDMHHTFCIRHYAGVVRYRIDSFLDKNSNVTSRQFHDLLASSTLAILHTTSASSQTPSRITSDSSLGSMTRSPTPSTKKTSGSMSYLFSMQMRTLTSELNSTRSNFIRCIKPNAAMDARVFDRRSVLDQLRSSGTIQACQVLQVGLPTRVSYVDVASIYTTLLGADFMFDWFHASDRVFTQALCHVLGFPADAYRLGDSRLFFKTGQIHLLDSVLQVSSPSTMTPDTLKAALTHYMAKRRWVSAATKVAVCRYVQLAYVDVQRKRHVIVLQCWFRQHLACRLVATERTQRRVANMWGRLVHKSGVQRAFDGAQEDKLALLEALLSQQRAVPSGCKWLLQWLGPMQRTMYVQKLGRAACVGYLAKRVFVAMFETVRERRACVQIQAQVRRVAAAAVVDALRKRKRAHELWRRIRIRVKATIWFFAMYRRAHVSCLERDNARLRVENAQLQARFEGRGGPHELKVRELERQVQRLQQQLNEATNVLPLIIQPNDAARHDVQTNDMGCQVDALAWPHMTLLRGGSSSHGLSSHPLRRVIDADMTSQFQREVQQQQELTQKIREIVRICTSHGPTSPP
ncbi:hypothetical protein, variant 1 [Aphanomyces astaci]|uniref:Myosin motor domain-containing protein n=1 Tax=Aphanomyces astaci TaxID=112090 RepID=W4HC46_APHAT|nr:hypothetical protein, variant 1 [Aphanomyces astaci]ETV88864.1 hypothetical protein, variant 1 [Aphanomyces astaci]|eukprot:XP_009821264.1 hypothetical protein, variant 1 [Aphanomyces astaci]